MPGNSTSTWAALAAALLVVLAGCAGGVGTGPSGPDATTDTAAATVTAGGNGTATGDDGADGDGGTVNFYLSDERNAIGDFDSLNVTVTEVVLVRADGEDATGMETNGTGVNGSETAAEAGGTETNETERGDADDADEAEDGERVVYEVDNATVDLTELQGANATMIGSLPVPNGTYTSVFVRVSDVNATLTDGSSADVKLPSSRLKLNERVVVGDGQAVDFVFDISVVERGTQGYVLKPVASQSGTGDRVEIRDVAGDRGKPDGKQADGEMGEKGAKGAKGTDDGDGQRGDAGSSNGSDGASGQGSMDFYLSDAPNAMGDFAHLNVTVTKVGLKRGGENGTWVEHDVEERSVDLTTLLGANATRLGTFGVDNGTYTKVFVYVDGIDATLENGETTRVKLPSNKLRLNTEFTVGDGQEVDFVYDMSVLKAGNSGKYVLKPVVSESGTGDEVPIEDVDGNGTEETETDDATDLNASFVGTVTAGENATVEATRNGSAVENATVTVTRTVDGAETTATRATDANGTVTFAVDANATALSVTVEADGDEVELEREFETEAGTAADAGSDGDGGGNGNGNGNAGGNGSAGGNGNGNGDVAMRFVAV